MKQIFKKDYKHFKVKDHIKSGDLFQLYKDNNSGIVWTFLDKNHNHEHYYLSEKYIPHKEKKGFLGFLYLFVQKIMFRYKLKNLKDESPEFFCEIWESISTFIKSWLKLISDFLIVVVRPEFTVLSKSVTDIDIFYLSKLPSLLIFFCNCRIP